MKTLDLCERFLCCFRLDGTSARSYFPEHFYVGVAFLVLSPQTLLSFLSRDIADNTLKSYMVLLTRKLAAYWSSLNSCDFHKFVVHTSEARV
jgi:hypothetical protein